MKKVSIVIPVYNEASNIHPLLEELENKLLMSEYEFELIFVDDGSTDDSLEILQKACFRGKAVGYLSFSRNFGHQNALKAGLDMSSGDCVIMMDGDLQHPPELIPALLEKWKEGYDIVYTRRKEDKRLSWLKRHTSSWFYGWMGYMSGLQMEKGLADFRLLSRQVCDTFGVFHEQDLFIRGMIKWLGFSQYALDYAPHPRFSGKTKYNSRKMVEFAVQGITSFSVKPLNMSFFLGILFSVMPLIFIPFMIRNIIRGIAVDDWVILIIAIMFFGGLQMLLLSIVGLYVGKIFMQSKQRPTYIIKTTNLTDRRKTG